MAEERIFLHKTGESGRKAFIFPLYRIAHYTDVFLDKGDILDYQGPKAVRMIFQRKIGGQRIQQEIKKAIRKRVSPENWKVIRDSATTFCRPYTIGEVNKGDLFSVVWFADGWLVSQFNGKEISRLRDPKFARALWSIWVGEQSLVNADDLLNGWTIDD
ncbi:MAG: chalcone isomerase family protein [Verrucomicrobia bacterium]|nr:chalcone isomerase family protein [Verrucomicrobiota bacterium]